MRVNVYDYPPRDDRSQEQSAHGKHKHLPARVSAHIISPLGLGSHIIERDKSLASASRRISFHYFSNSSQGLGERLTRVCSCVLYALMRRGRVAAKNSIQHVHNILLLLWSSSSSSSSSLLLPRDTHGRTAINQGFVRQPRIIINLFPSFIIVVIIAATAIKNVHKYTFASVLRKYTYTSFRHRHTHHC
uniref:Uncharacterized protein n=1 Tax=Sipha flava TaxID=143950 RepID=A0A2S2RB66_9HEMI